MFRLIALVVAALTLAAGGAEAAPFHLERVIIVMRHGVRPPTQPNLLLAKYSDQAWPDWPVLPGELTPHGGQTVKLMGDTLRAAYRAKLPGSDCAGVGAVTVWADSATTRTRDTGRILAAALAPGCDLEADWAGGVDHDPLFGDADSDACHVDADEARAFALANPPSQPLPPTDDALARLQAIFAPTACNGGAGTCFATAAGTVPGSSSAVFPAASSLAEDLLLEYTEGKPMNEVGWGRASAAEIAAVMPLHERAFALIRANTYVAGRHGGPMASDILTALAGKAAPSSGPQWGQGLRVLAFAGHDTNLVLMASIFGLHWTLPDEPDGTAPSTALVFELWSDGQTSYVRPVIYYETMDQLRSLQPGEARKLALQFDDCASGPMGSCPLEKLQARAQAVVPPGCDET